jgi:3-methyladenine DNA glycosylase AlkD
MQRQSLNSELEAAGDPKRALSSEWFFKTGPGQYGEGDVFLGLAVPVLRKIAYRHLDLKLPSLRKLLQSEIHEHRLAALEILVAQYERAEEADKKAVYEFYLLNTDRINNWDLVDASAPYIVGHYLLKRSRAILRKLAKSENLWERRIAIVATFGFMRVGETKDTFQIATMLLKDKHDLIRKAVGWALREAGKKSHADLLSFLQEHYTDLSRTTLRYAIERFPPQLRERMLAGNFSAFTSRRDPR